MAQVFHQNDPIFVNSGNQRHPSWTEYVFVDYFSKRKGIGRFGSDNWIQDINGKYVGYKSKQQFIICWNCNGEGTMKPEGFSETATYRVKCPECDGNGQADASIKYTRYQINRRDLVMTAEDYAPVKAEQEAQKMRQIEANQKREERINGLVGDLLIKADQLFSIVREQNRPGFLKEGEQPIDIEHEMAKWLRNQRDGELSMSASRVIENRKPRCSVEDCNSIASYDGMCYSHWNIVQQAAAFAEQADVTEEATA